MVYVCAQIEDIFRFRRDRLGFYAEIQITFGTVYILAAIQITFGTVYMLGLAGRQAGLRTAYKYGLQNIPIELMRYTACARQYCQAIQVYRIELQNTIEQSWCPQK